MSEGSCPQQLQQSNDVINKIKTDLTDFANKMSANGEVLTRLQSSLVNGEDDVSKELRKNLYEPLLDLSNAELGFIYTAIVLALIFLMQIFKLNEKLNKKIQVICIFLLFTIALTLLNVFHCVLVAYIKDCLEYDKNPNNNQEECNKIRYKRNIINYILFFQFIFSVGILSVLALFLIICIIAFLIVYFSKDEFSSFGSSKLNINKNELENFLNNLAGYDFVTSVNYCLSTAWSVAIIIGPSVVVGNSKFFQILKQECQ